MKYQNLKKLVACLLAGAMTLGCLTACGNEGKEETKQSTTQETKQSEVSKESESVAQTEEGIEVVYPMKEKVKLTLAVKDDANVTAIAKNIGENEFGKAWQEATGVELEVISYANNDALTLMLSSGELPDIIWGYNFNSYPGGVSTAIEDGIIEPIGNYLEYAPDIATIMNENDLYRKTMSTDDGVIWGAPMLRDDDYLCASSGLMIRADWLKDLKLDMPETPDDLYKVLKAFKEEKGAEVPFSLVRVFLTSHCVSQGFITSGFGLAKTDWYVDNGEVHYGYAEKEFKDVLVWLKKLYDEELLDPNFQTVDTATANANFLNGKSGVTYGAVGSGLGTYLSTETEDPNFAVAGFGPLVANKGDTALCTAYSPRIVVEGAVITTACKNKEAAAMFLNYGYTEEGKLLFNFGTEGKSYTMVNGVPTYTEEITNNPNMTKVQALSYWATPLANGAYVQMKDYMEQYNGLPEQVAAISSWCDSSSGEHHLPGVIRSGEDATEFSKIMGDIGTYAFEMMLKYITGLEDLDKFETEYLPTLEEMGMARAIEIQQKALDEFNAR